MRSARARRGPRISSHENGKDALNVLVLVLLGGNAGITVEELVDESWPDSFGALVLDREGAVSKQEEEEGERARHGLLRCREQAEKA